MLKLFVVDAGSCYRVDLHRKDKGSIGMTITLRLYPTKECDSLAQKSAICAAIDFADALTKFPDCDWEARIEQ